MNNQFGINFSNQQIQIRFFANIKARDLPAIKQKKTSKKLIFSPKHEQENPKEAIQEQNQQKKHKSKDWRRRPLKV